MITLKNVYTDTGETCAPFVMQFLFDLLAERREQESISHKRMPQFVQHQAFVRSRPYREWWLVMDGIVPVGAVYLTKGNEIGISIKREYQGRGYGPEAVRQILSMFDPLQPRPSQRSEKFIAHVNPANVRSRKMFEHLGAQPLMVTYELPSKTH